jgi:hypothetical protein
MLRRVLRVLVRPTVVLCSARSKATPLPQSKHHRLHTTLPYQLHRLAATSIVTSQPIQNPSLMACSSTSTTTSTATDADGSNHTHSFTATPLDPSEYVHFDSSACNESRRVVALQVPIALMNAAKTKFKSYASNTYNICNTGCHTYTERSIH